MKWYQSFPYPTPPDRAYVHWRPSQVERIAVEDGAYGLALQRMGRQSPEGFWMIEWDIALGLRDIETLEAAARWKPDVLHVCSYDLYWTSTREDVVQWNQPLQQRETPEPVIRSSRSILNCDYPGLGVVWFPERVIAWMEESHKWELLRYPDADATFWRLMGSSARHVVRDVQLVHLHW